MFNLMLFTHSLSTSSTMDDTIITSFLSSENDVSYIYPNISLFYIPTAKFICPVAILKLRFEILSLKFFLLSRVASM